MIDGGGQQAEGGAQGGSASAWPNREAASETPLGRPPDLLRSSNQAGLFNWRDGLGLGFSMKRHGQVLAWEFGVEVRAKVGAVRQKVWAIRAKFWAVRAKSPGRPFQGRK